MYEYEVCYYDNDGIKMYEVAFGQCEADVICEYSDVVLASIARVW